MAIEERPCLDGACMECGEMNPSVHYMPECRAVLEARRMCFLCSFWTDVTNERARHVVVAGVAYAPCAEQPGQDGKPVWGAGFGGHTFTIQRIGEAPFECCNLWCRGYVPEHFRDRLPDNARFIPQEDA